MIILDVFLDILFPKTCVGCGFLGTYLCDECSPAISFYKSTLCPVCMKAIVPIGVHKRCEGHTKLDGLYVIAKHEGVIQDLVSAVKYQGAFDITHLLGDIMAWQMTHTPHLPQSQVILTAVPMYWMKQNERGFNQSELLAKEVSKRTKLIFVPKLLKKIKNTKPQVNLKREERLKNQAHVFMCPYTLKDRPTIIIIDDVVTTGTTFSACAEVLKQAGAKKVYGLAIAHGR